MANITQLTDTLWTGGDLPANERGAVHDIAAWCAAGINVVVDCRHEWSDEALVARFAPGLRYVHVGIDDAGQRVAPSWFERIYDVASGSPSARVLVHCHMGINRGPSAAYGLLLAAGHKPVNAITLIRSRRPIAAVGYAEDALLWWHNRCSASLQQRRDDRAALARWRRSNPHDTVRIIREIRQQELGA